MQEHHELARRAARARFDPRTIEFGSHDGDSCGKGRRDVLPGSAREAAASGNAFVTCAAILRKASPDRRDLQRRARR